MARVLANQRVTSPNHFQDTRHIELDLEHSGIAYEPGDLLNIVPRQDPAAVQQFLRRLGLDGSAHVSVSASARTGAHAQAPSKQVK